MRHVLLVMSNPVDGQEDEYNDWYDHVHLGDVLKVPGFVAAQRFRAAEPMPGREGPPRQYLAIYEIEADDVGAAISALSKAVTGMVISPAIDGASAMVFPFTEHGARVTA